MSTSASRGEGASSGLDNGQVHPDWIRRVFLIAGLTNFTILLFDRGFTNATLTAAFPAVFSWVGIVSILLWGLAYIAVADRYHQVPGVVAVFALEKFFYVGTWIFWLVSQGHRLGEIWTEDPITALFLSGYGLADGAFGLFFAWVAWRCRSRR